LLRLCYDFVTFDGFLCDIRGMNTMLFVLPLGVAAVFAYLMWRSEMR
jgi:hypothetical protein